MTTALLLSLMLAAAQAATTPPQQPPPQEQQQRQLGPPTPDQDERITEMQLQRDQAAVTALNNALGNLQEYRDLLQYQAEIQRLSEHLQQLRAARAAPPPAPSK